MPLIATLVGAAALASANDDSWAKFSAHHALSHVDVDVEIGWGERTQGEPVYTIRRSIRKLRQKAQTTQTDTKSCPRMLAALRALRDLPMPRPSMPPLPGDEVIITADGTAYSLTISATYPGASAGDLTVGSNVDTPLAAWVDDALATLDSCMPK